MKTGKAAGIALIALCLAAPGFGAPGPGPAKKKLVVVDSYHREYLWSQHVHEGFCAALLKYGYFDDEKQKAEYTENDTVETSTAIVKKLWLDAKRKSTKEELSKATLAITKTIRDFKPDLIFVGDDEAADYIGNQFLDAKIPVVFWGLNTTPVKYGLVDNAERPGHNVTGIYQTSYYAESLELLTKIKPGIKTFAILSDDTTTGRIHVKTIQYLLKSGHIPLKLAGVVATSSSEEWKSKALELQTRVDAFFVAQYSGLKDKNDQPVTDEEMAAWYLTHITIPEAAGYRHRVVQGMLCAADDSGYNQGYEAVSVAHDILDKKADPAKYPPRAPRRGPFMANKQRAKMLGITLTKDMGIEEYIEKASVLNNGPK